MRHALSVFLALLMVARLSPAAPDTASITTQITSIPLGAQIELRLTNKQKLRGTRGALTNTGFAFAEAHSGERQAFSNRRMSLRARESGWLAKGSFLEFWR